MSSSDSSVPQVPSYIATGRFANGSADNHAGSVWISTLLCLVYSTLVITLRGHLRWNVFSLDDYVILIATVLQTFEVVAMVIALQHGLGQSHTLLSAVQISHTNTATFVSMVFFIASACFAKLSVILLMMRLFNLNGPRSRYDNRGRILWSICLTAAVVTILWAVGSIIGLLVNCSISSIMTADSSISCPHQDLRWSIIGSIDIATEILLVVLSVIIVWPVQLKTSLKIPIVFAFSFRLLCALLSALHMKYMQKSSSTTNTTTLALMQTELSWSLISATIPTLNAFMRSFNSNFSISGDTTSTNNSSSNKNGNVSWRSRSAGTVTTVVSPTRRAEYELDRVRSYRMPSNATTLRGSPVVGVGVAGGVPRRPSRKDVDIDGIGIHAGIPPVPGFGARDFECRAVGTSGSEYTSSPELSGCGHMGIGIADGGGSVDGMGGSVNSSEHIIRKDVQFEVRYEMV